MKSGWWLQLRLSQMSASANEEPCDTQKEEGKIREEVQEFSLKSAIFITALQLVI